MTYTFKLSRRLAISNFHLVFTPLFLLCACTLAETTEPATLESAGRDRPRRLVDLVIAPRADTLIPTEKHFFVAKGVRRNGDTVVVSATWAATGGQISSHGEYNAGSTPGDYRVVATFYGGALADTSEVVISALPGPMLSALVLTPASVTLSAGASQQFTVTGLMSDSATVSVTATYVVLGGTITDGGLYTAGPTAGTYQVIATQTGGTLADTSAVTITPPSPAPPTPPPPGITIAVGQNWQTKVNANPNGTVFRILAGTHIQQAVIPKTGNQFIGDPGAIMDGENTTDFAFAGAAANLRFKNLEIKRYDGQGSLGAIQGFDANGWVLDSLNVHDNAFYGANLRGSFTVLGGSYHHNGKMALTVNQATPGSVIDGAELSYSNLAGAHNPLWDAGGIKVSESNGFVIRNTYSHHNNGPGLWYDIDNQNGLLENNLVTDNTEAGIFYEISYTGVIRGNTITNNGTADLNHTGAGILVSESPDVEVYNNLLSGNSHGIIALQTERGSGVAGLLQVKNLWVHNNTITQTIGQRSGMLNFISAVDGIAMMSTRNNRFNLNAYTVTGNATPFNPGGLTPTTIAGWRALGQDQNSTFTGP
jgi:parallel beta-helix repeat protein